jgi:ATP-binding cassette subfamily B protein
MNLNWARQVKNMQDKQHIGQNRGPHTLFGGPKARANDTRSTLKRIWSYLGKYKGKLISVFLLVLMSSGAVVAGPYLISRAIDDFISTGITKGFMTLLCILGVNYLIGAGAIYMQQFVMIGVSQQAVGCIRSDMFSKLMSYSVRLFDTTSNGDLMSQMTNDTDNINTMLTENIALFFSSILMIAGIGIMMFILNPIMAIITIASIPFILLIVRTIAKVTGPAYKGQQKYLGAINGIIEESLSGYKEIKAYCKEEDVCRGFEEQNDMLKKSSVKAELFSGFMGPTMNMMNNIQFAIIVGTGGYLAVKGMVSVGVIAAFLNYSKQFGRPIVQIANVYNTIQAAIAGAERVFKTMDGKPEINDVENAVVVDKLEGVVEFRNVDFGYNVDKMVLNNASFKTNIGDKVAIVGPTGAGKTTIINLITRFYDIEKGEILIDGMNIQDIRKDDLRRNLGFVLQDTYLFSDSVRENIRYGRLDATDNEVEEAAKLSNADLFIKNLPDGYDSMLSHEGGNLSQGQRQLLAIARAILSNPSILILDEATSSVDTRTELHIQSAMNKLMEGRTSFVIAHRLSTIKDATTIMVVNDGSIIERGSHSELLKKKGFYHNLYFSQYQES